MIHEKPWKAIVKVKIRIFEKVSLGKKSVSVVAIYKLFSFDFIDKTR